MDIEDLKKDWESLGKEDIIKLSDLEMKSIIDKHNNKSKWKAFLPECIFILIYLYLAIFLVLFNQHFSNFAYQILLFLTVGILLLISGLIYSTINLFNRNVLISESYKKSISCVVNECEELNKRYYVILSLSLLICIFGVILFPKIYSEDLTINQILLTSFISVIILGFLKFRIYVYYKRLIRNNVKFKNNLIE